MYAAICLALAHHIPFEGSNGRELPFSGAFRTIRSVMDPFAIIATGGKQYTVTPGQKLKVEKLAGEEGDKVTFDQVLLSSDGSKVQVGAPLVPGAGVKGTILRQARSKKVTVFKYHSKNRFDKKKGHRQHFTEVQIESL